MSEDLSGSAMENALEEGTGDLAWISWEDTAAMQARYCVNFDSCGGRGVVKKWPGEKYFKKLKSTKLLVILVKFREVPDFSTRSRVVPLRKASAEQSSPRRNRSMGSIKILVVEHLWERPFGRWTRLRSGLPLETRSRSYQCRAGNWSTGYDYDWMRKTGAYAIERKLGE